MSLLAALLYRSLSTEPVGLALVTACACGFGLGCAVALFLDGRWRFAWPWLVLAAVGALMQWA